jgi:simple sugar transport system ATP-binding protein
LSGGNQQKVVIAREFQRNPKILIAAQPTRGLDVGATEFVHNQIMDIKKRGKAVLLVSLELSEIMNLSDRILVIYEGKIRGEFDAKNVTESELGLIMAGGDN